MPEFESNAVLANRIAELQRENSKLQSEHNELVATVEALQREFKDARNTLQTIAGCTWDSGAEEIADVALDEAKRWVSRYDDSILNKLPQQHLRDRDAEAVEMAIKSCVIVECFGTPCISVRGLTQYAEKVRSGEL